MGKRRLPAKSALAETEAQAGAALRPGHDQPPKRVRDEM